MGRLLCVALVGCLAACGGGAPERTDDGRIVLDYWEKWTGFEAEAMQEIVDLFNESQDEWFVRYLDDAGSQIDTKLLISIAGGDPPDIAGFWNDRLPDYVLNGALSPLDHRMELDGINPDDYLPAVLESCQYDGMVWGLPLTPATLALHWNRDLFREAGLDPDTPPRTIAEFNEFAERLTLRDESGRITQLAFSPDIPGWWNHLWPIWFGGEVWDGEGRITVDSPEHIACLEWLRDYRESVTMSELERFKAAAENFDSPQWPFFNGRVAMVLQGPWTANFIRRHAPDLDWAAGPFPSASADLGAVTYLQTDLLVIPRGCSNPDGAWEFIRFTQQPEMLERLNRAHCKFSPLREVSEEFYDGHPNHQIQMFADLASGGDAQISPELPRYREFQAWLGRMHDEVYRLDREPAEVVAEVSVQLQRILDRAVRVAEARRGSLGE